MDSQSARPFLYPGTAMIISDEKVYNFLKRRANEFGWIRISRTEIAAGTGLTHWTVHMALARLMEAERLWWEKPAKVAPDRYKIALYTIDPTVSRFEYRDRQRGGKPRRRQRKKPHKQGPGSS